MRKDFLPFSRPSISEEDIAAVGNVLRSGWITTGPQNAEFEKKFCEYVGCPGAASLSSATGGMHLLLKALGVGPGDEVITASMTWVSTVNLIVLAGAKPVFADVDRDTLMITPETIAPLITPRTKLIIPVHFAGAPVDLDGISALAAKHNIPVVQDAAHAIGTFYKGVHVGKTGTSIFSFHPIKNITSGEGGMFCSDDSALMDRIRRLKFHGLGVDSFDRKMQGRSPQAQVIEPGFKYNLTDIAAVLGLRQLARVDSFNKKRDELTMLYRKELESVPELSPLSDPKYPCKHARHLFIVRLDIDKVGMSRFDFMAALKERNIGSGLHFMAAHLQKFYLEQMGCKRGMLPDTEWNSDRIMSLPLFPDMNGNDIGDVIAAIKDVLVKK